MSEIQEEKEQVMKNSEIKNGQCPMTMSKKLSIEIEVFE